MDAIAGVGAGAMFGLAAVAGGIAGATMPGLDSKTLKVGPGAKANIDNLPDKVRK